MRYTQTREVQTMLIILSLYSSILALAVWQENQGEAFPES